MHSETILQHRFRGHTVVIHGAASALGHAVSVRFAAEGAQVVLVDPDEAQLRAGAAGLVASRVLLHGQRLDSAASAQALRERVLERFGPVKAWVNVMDASRNERAALSGCEAVHADLADQQGSIVNLRSGARRTDAGDDDEASVQALIRWLALDQGGRRVRVNGVDHAGVDDAGTRRSMAALACFLASAEADCLDGVVLPLHRADARPAQVALAPVAVPLHWPRSRRAIGLTSTSLARAPAGPLALSR